jgi:hypothetical protein
MSWKDLTFYFSRV